MAMKRQTLYLILSFCLPWLNSFAQLPRIKFQKAESYNSYESVYTGSVNPDYLASFEPVSFNIYFWGINRGDGTSEKPMTYNDVEDVMRSINEVFNPHGIYFVLKGYSYVNNDALNSGATHWQIRDYMQQNKHIVSDAFNCFVPYDFKEGASANGWTELFSKTLSIRMKWAFNYKSKSTPHELGHILGLYHTFGKSGNGDIIKEHVTRNPDDPNYNALTEGDYIHDTPAMPNFFNPKSFGTVPKPPNQDASVVDCIYIGNITDEQGTPFVLTPYDVGNIMGYTPCKNANFTPGQAIRMMETIYFNEAKNKNILEAKTKTLKK